MNGSTHAPQRSGDESEVPELRPNQSPPDDSAPTVPGASASHAEVRPEPVRRDAVAETIGAALTVLPPLGSNSKEENRPIENPVVREHQIQLKRQEQLLERNPKLAAELVKCAASWEGKAKEGDRLLWTIMNWIPEGLMVIGGPPDFPIKMVSRFARESVMRDPASIVGMSTADHQSSLRIFLPDGKTVPKSEEMPIYRATRFGEEVHNCELVVYGRNGRRFAALVDAVPIRDDAGNVVGAVSCWRDVTELNVARHALERAMAELEHRVDQRTRELNAANETLRCEVDRRHLLEKRLVAMLENEQRQIGQELHDNIGSQLSGVELLCEAMLRQGRHVPLRGVRTVAGLIRKTLEDTRRIAHSMAPVPSCAHGLGLSLRALARRTRTTSGCRCTLRSRGAPIVDASVALHLYRITQEAIANAVRHGAARQIAIVLNSSAAGVRLLIRDDGSGIPAKLPDDLGLGIVTMKIRANTIGGFLEVNRNSSGGTDVICSIPRYLSRSHTSRHP